MKPKVILTRKLSDSVETRMRELFDAELSSDDQPLSTEQLVELMQRADVLVPTVTDKIDAEMLEQAGANLKLIASFGTCLLYTSPSPRDGLLSRMPSSA